MKLYLLKVIDESKLDYEEFIGFVVMARSAKEARNVVLKRVKTEFSNEDEKRFSDPEQTSCTWIGDARETVLGKEPVIVLESNTGA